MSDDTAIYLFIVDLDERGTFRAHVDEYATGREVFEIDTDEEEGQNWLVDAGYMKHNEDLDGLRDYLIEMKIIPSGAILTDNEDEAEELQAEKDDEDEDEDEDEEYD